MGITGLLPLLKSITRKTHVESLAGYKVAVDAYSWLHKGVYSCAIDIYYNRPTNGFIEFCLGRIRLLRNHNVEPIMIFDGTHLPIKSSKELERRSKRHAAKLQLEAIVSREGSVSSEAAKTLAAKAIDVTPEMAWQLIQVLKREQVKFIVAPYEADAQMAYLSKIGKVEAIITEDSDLLLYGVKRCLFKMDKLGNVDEIRTEDLGQVREIALHTFSLVMFRHMCIMAGCDYLDGINGIGLKTIHKYFSRYRTADKVIDAMKKDLDSHLVPINYDKKFIQAELAFLHQYVWDPDLEAIANYSPIDLDYVRELGIDDLTEFLGDGIMEYAKEIAMGTLNPITLKPFFQSSQEIREEWKKLEEELERRTEKNKESIPSTPPPSQKHSQPFATNSQLSSLNSSFSSSQPFPPPPPSFFEKSDRKVKKELLKPELPFKLTVDRIRKTSNQSNDNDKDKGNGNESNANMKDYKNIEEGKENSVNTNENVVADRITLKKRSLYHGRPLELPGMTTCINLDCKPIKRKEIKIANTISSFLKKKQ